MGILTIQYIQYIANRIQYIYIGIYIYIYIYIYSIYIQYIYTVYIYSIYIYIYIYIYSIYIQYICKPTIYSKPYGLLYIVDLKPKPYSCMLGSAVNSTQCDCPDECVIPSYLPGVSQSLLSQYSVDWSLSNVTRLTDAYLYALEVGNRVDESTMLTTVSLLESTLSSHYAIRQAIRTNFSTTSTSMTTSILSVVQSFCSIIQDDLVNSGMKLLASYQSCYGQDRNNIINIILMESSVCTHRFSILMSMFQRNKQLYSVQDYA